MTCNRVIKAHELVLVQLKWMQAGAVKPYFNYKTDSAFYSFTIKAPLTVTIGLMATPSSPPPPMFYEFPSQVNKWKTTLYDSQFLFSVIRLSEEFNAVE